MTVRRHLGRFLAALALLSPGGAAALEYIPFAGFEGYQEIRIDDDLYFVAFHGTRNTPVAEIDAAWRTRAAQLCLAAGAGHFMPLRYSFEPVLKDEPARGGARRSMVDGSFIHAAAAPIYIPIFTSRPSGGFIDAPSRQGHVRCVRDPSLAIAPDRLVEAERTVEAANARGWAVARTR
jgi:hypothetical protein